MGRERCLDHLCGLDSDSKVAAQKRLSGGRTQTDEHLWLDELDFLLQPGKTSRDLALAPLLVHPPLALGHPFEMLDHVGDVSIAAVDAGRLKPLVEQAAGGPDDRLPLDVPLRP